MKIHDVNEEDEVVLASGGLRQKLVKQFLTEIFQGKLPSGTRLIVLKLAKRFGISSTPIRESLLELGAMGIIRLDHNRGATVNPFGAVELREIYQIRRILETEATRTACGKISASDLQELHDAMNELASSKSHNESWSERAMYWDGRFHEAIVEAAGSHRLAVEIQRYGTLVQIIREVIGNRREGQMRAIEDHLSILQSLKSGDAEVAAAAMARHIGNSAAAAESALFPDTGDPPA
jgi:DNA-binding GntR family transcriptional regulator